MTTEIIYMDRENIDPDRAERAGKLIREGKLVVIPTETVYGLAANALDERAVAEIFRVKGRPQDNPLIVHISRAAELEEYCEGVDSRARALMDAFFPGPLTLVLRKKPVIPGIVSAGLDTVAVRMPSHPVAHAIIAAAKVPVAAPSANLSGRPSPTSAAHIRGDLHGKVSMIVDGGVCDFGVESTVLSLAGEATLLRPGAVTPAMLEELIGPVKIAKSILSEISEEHPASPGMKYRHYAPKAEMLLVEGDRVAAAEFITGEIARLIAGGHSPGVLCFDGEGADYPGSALAIEYGEEDDCTALMRNIFDCLYKFDGSGITHIFARCPPESNESLALLNRMLRAAGHRRVRL